MTLKMIDQGHWQPGFAELSKEERLPDTFVSAVTPRGCSDLHRLAKVPQGSSASKNSMEGGNLSCAHSGAAKSFPNLQTVEATTSKI